MTKTVMMMMAQLTTATEQVDLTAEGSRCISLLDFRKAYDTVDRDFLYESMRLFGFTDSFIDLICRIQRARLQLLSLKEVNLPRSRCVPESGKAAHLRPSSFNS
uniref:Reverse transcriptase domain-containing protein n=1 Tax=Peronospora matthiolae TaxID=2874970 RepID=A0AAV1UFP2_9STRA